MKYTGTMTRMQRGRLPSTPVACALDKPCAYRAKGVCDEPRTNKGNSDAACHAMSNRAIYALLTANAELTWPHDMAEQNR